MMNEKLLMAIGDIDAAIVRDAKEKIGIQKKGRRASFRRMVTVLAAAMLVLALAGTVAATAIGAADWFMNFFADRTGGILNPTQQGYIEDNADVVGKTDESWEYLVTVESAIYDGRTALIKLKVTAPEDVVLNASQYCFRIQELVIAGQKNHRYAGGIENGRTEDTDDLPNTVDMLVTVHIDDDDMTFYSYPQWKLKLGNLVSMEFDPKTGDIHEFSVRPGTWEFDLDFEIRDGMQELVDTPVEAWGLYDMSYEKDIPIYVTSIRLSAMTMELNYVYPNPEDAWGALEMHDVVVVLKDGKEVAALPKGFSFGTDSVGWMRFEMSVPIAVEDVDHVILRNGITVPVPTEAE